jgi:hypothetical protein
MMSHGDFLSSRRSNFGGRHYETNNAISPEGNHVRAKSQLVIPRHVVENI